MGFRESNKSPFPLPLLSPQSELQAIWSKKIIKKTYKITIEKVILGRGVASRLREAFALF